MLRMMVLLLCLLLAANMKGCVSSFWEETTEPGPVLENTGAETEEAELSWNRDWEWPELPAAEGTVLTAQADPTQMQVLYLWEEGKVPANTVLDPDREYADPADFCPYVTFFPVQAGVEVKGAILLCAGGAFQFRGNWGDTYPTAWRLNELGYQCFVVDYRLRPYTQQEGALDLARAVRFVRANADVYGIDPKDIAVVGYSAGGILCGEMVLNWKGYVTPDALVEGYIPDALDSVNADVAGIGHIYSFYGRLSVGSKDVEKFRESNLPPTFYAYGTVDPFFRQFVANADAVRCGKPVWLWRNIAMMVSPTALARERRIPTGFRSLTVGLTLYLKITKCNSSQPEFRLAAVVLVALIVNRHQNICPVAQADLLAVFWDPFCISFFNSGLQ